MKTLYLDGNGWVIKRDDIKDDTGAAPDPALTARCFLALGEEVDGELEILDVAIHASLEVSGATMIGGSLRAPLSGTSITTHIGPLLAAAELVEETLDIYDRVIIAGSYSDYERVRVVRERPAGLP